ncbi:hypothetical protein DES53_10911 [Roseimicrobium gellanilyticum]|uniref:Uncharacterized protein n=1 Tax=Roseimicrobium gellanilyticum TaxID=748857 RepID=A0A366HDA0_9BACT|nr:hypothetical protein [Roseimicrobium gellanilyticum]RBP39584.1 hypothetical protein DES53_10911 [Roseimicrobium gellanilyticum]
MPSSRALFIPVTATVAGLTAGFTMAFLVPLPEERIFNELSKVQVGPVKWENVSAKAAVAELNAQVEKANRSAYRVKLAERQEPYHDITLSLEFQNSIPATECARYIAELSGSGVFATPDGLVIDDYDHGHRYGESSWRRSIRSWVTNGLPNYFRKKPEPSVSDPFAAP